MACVFLFYSSSCHKKKHEESHIGNGSRTSCYLAPRPCRERWTLLVVVSPSTPCRERYPQMKEREHGVQHSNELPARTLHIGNGSRTCCSLASRPCREHWTWRCRLTASPCREHHPRLRKESVKYDTQWFTSARITTYVQDQIHGKGRRREDEIMILVLSEIGAERCYAVVTWMRFEKEVWE